MLLGFTKPRIEGTFSGEHMRAWDTIWGDGTAKVVIENSYAIVSESVITGRRVGDHGRRDVLARLSAARQRRGDQRARASSHGGRLRICATRSSSTTIRSREFVSGEYHLYGKYETPFGFGRLVIDQGVAYGETFDTATASLRFEGAGVRLDGARHPEEHRRRDRRRVGRLGRQLFVQRRRRADSGRVARRPPHFRARRCQGCCSSRRPAPARSRCRATTCACASTICLPATKASGS